MSRVAAIALAVLAILIIVWWFIPGDTAPRGITKDISYAKQVWIACRVYADEHDGEYPPALDILVPDYIEDQRTPNILRDENSRDRWIYYRPQNKTHDENHLLVESTYKIKDRKIYGFTDGSVHQMTQDRFRKTMNKRPTSKQR